MIVSLNYAELMVLQSSNRATPFLNAFKRVGRMPAAVEYVAAGSRFKSVYEGIDCLNLLTSVAGYSFPKIIKP